MGYVVRHALPVMIRRGEDETLSLTLFDDAGVAVTPSDGSTVDVYAGSTAIVSAGAVTEGTTNTYALTGSLTTSESLSETWLIVWTMVISGADHVFQQEAYLVRRLLYPTITDTDLIDHHTDLADLLDPSESTFENFRVEGWNTINAELIKKGRRPQLVTGGWALRLAHIYLSLCLVFRDFASSNGGGRYQELAIEYHKLFKDEMESLVLTYDEDEDGFIDADEGGKPARPTLFLSAPKPTTGSF